MKPAKLLLGTLGAYFVFTLVGTSFTACSKTQTVHDTTYQTIVDTNYVTVKDTIIVNDTVIVVDTLFDPNNGLVAYFNFTGGNLNDSSGYGNNINFSNATLTSDRFGNPDNAYYFNGTSTYMTVPNSASLNPGSGITLFAIVKPQGFYEGSCHGNQVIFKGYASSVQGYYDLGFYPANNGVGSCALSIDTTKEVFQASYGDDIPVGSNAGSEDTSGPYIQENQWYTVAFTYDGTTANFYIDGQLVNSQVYSGIAFTPNMDDLYLGATPNPPDPYWLNGVIDEIRIYNQAVPQKDLGYLSLLRNKYLKVKNKLIY